MSLLFCLSAYRTEQSARTGSLALCFSGFLKEGYDWPETHCVRRLRLRGIICHIQIVKSVCIFLHMNLSPMIQQQLNYFRRAGEDAHTQSGSAITIDNVRVCTAIQEQSCRLDASRTCGENERRTVPMLTEFDAGSVIQ
ncbi:MAG: hypothetical protein JWL77_4161 [Chthonomonadaceae bacterium]|nr:hypothetical protein [Chthonomonadaceae bacterium]